MDAGRGSCKDRREMGGQMGVCGRLHRRREREICKEPASETERAGESAKNKKNANPKTQPDTVLLS